MGGADKKMLAGQSANTKWSPGDSLLYKFPNIDNSTAIPAVLSGYPLPEEKYKNHCHP